VFSVKIGDQWKRVCVIEAQSHPKAFREAILCIKPEHYTKPIKLEQVEEKPN
jgi:hypothetical protein